MNKVDEVLFDMELEKYYGEAERIYMNEDLRASLKEIMINYGVMGQEDELNSIYLLPEGILIRFNENRWVFAKDEEEEE